MIISVASGKGGTGKPLVTFPKSPDSRRLRDEGERYLTEGKKATLRIHFADGKPGYELKVGE